jgi:hypothetical protein
MTVSRTHGSRRVAVVAMAIVLLAAACGSGSSDTAADDRDAGNDATTTAAAEDLTAPEDDPHLSPLVADPVVDGAERMTFRYGPIAIEPGQNNIAFTPPGVDAPEEAGYITRIVMDVQREDGSVPAVDVIHLHHGVLLNFSRTDTVWGGPQRVFAAGEEKTIFNAPEGTGYRHDPEDEFVLNYMVHNAFPIPDEVYIVTVMDLIPIDAPEAEGMQELDTIFMDVETGAYPVFDTVAADGVDGTYTYPQEDSYPGRRTNEWEVDREGVLIGGGGHVHPGGLSTDLWLERDGEKVLLFKSEAEYYTENEEPISWDVSMTMAPADWRINVQPGDVLSLTTTYDTTFGSWYEGMGISIVAMVEGTDGLDPFVDEIPTTGETTHGHLDENNNTGGEDTGIGDPADMPDGPEVDTILIEDFIYEFGDVSEAETEIPVVRQGNSITFDNTPDDLKYNGLWHTITSCALPCTNATGVDYPLADGPVAFDSGELGTGGEPAKGTNLWETPEDLETGTYAYWCRIHPFMRGAFRVVPTDYEAS